MKKINRIKSALLLCLSIAFLVTALPPAAHAARTPDGTCTHDPQFDIPLSATTPETGIVSTIIRDVKNVTLQLYFQLFENVLNNSSFQDIVATVLTLYIAVYGILFTFGMTQSTVYDFFVRMLKLSVVATLVIGGTFDVFMYFHTTVAAFFNEGTDEIIAKVSEITVGGINTPYTPNAPFAVLDGVIAQALSAKMAVTILAILFTGPYGIIFGLLLLFALKSFISALFTAIWVYLMGLVLRSLLFGLAPIFFVFLLFNKTKYLFDGWLNQIINSCLQPIFLFIFFGFFISLISASLANILGTPVCWTEWVDSVRGTPMAVHYWRFAIQENGVWVPYGGQWSWTGVEQNASPDARPFPIDIMHILVFLVLAELAGKFNGVVIMIAKDIAGAGTSLTSMQGPLSGWFSGTGGRNQNLVSNIGGRNVPGGITGGRAGAAGASASLGGIRSGGISSQISQMPTVRGGPK